ncbi:MAG: bifunctional precorrin-2 dehydrogenase/sirohydrochlorin ferrochelatase [Magnetococcales bacterium]|nr:bifunctional precorrin-2 dehydrogenase/sirohydrochlorin ferrochelatase [Magnetococcales bacterium]
MTGYMAELILEDQPVLMFGGGRVARRKLTGLVPAKAHITVVAPHLDPGVAEGVAMGEIQHEAGFYSLARLTRAPRPVLVFAATGDAGLNQIIAAACREQGLLCNSADDPRSSSLLVPAVVRRGKVSVAVSSGGLSPSLSRLLKERIDRWLEGGWGAVADLFGAERARVKESLPVDRVRHRFWRETALALDDEERVDAPDNSSWFAARLDQAKEVSREESGQ